MKKLLIAIVGGTAMTLVFSILAGMGGAACHCNTPLQGLFPFMSMLGVHTTDGTPGTLLWWSQFPIYLAIVVVPRKAEWKGVLALAMLIVHFVAISLALSVS